MLIANGISGYGKKRKKEKEKNLIPGRIDGKLLELLLVLHSSCSSQASPSRTDIPRTS